MIRIRRGGGGAVGRGQSAIRTLVLSWCLNLFNINSTSQMIQGLEGRTNNVGWYKLSQIFIVYMNSIADGEGVLLYRKIQNN